MDTKLSNILEVNSINKLYNCNYHVITTDGQENYSKITALINNIEAEIIIDCGAKQSVLPVSLVRRYKFPILKEQNCILANGSIDQCSETDNIDIVVHGTITRMKFLALPRSIVLLGLDWLNANGAYLISHKACLYLIKE